MDVTDQHRQLLFVHITVDTTTDITMDTTMVIMVDIIMDITDNFWAFCIKDFRLNSLHRRSCVMSYSFRKDNRSDEQFKNDIKKGHEKEQVWAKVMATDLSSRMGYPVTYVDAGIDNSGEVIFESSKKFSDPDFCFKFKDFERNKEIKTAPEYLRKYYTFKASAIKKAVQNDADVVLCRMEYYDTFDKAACEWMIKNLKQAVYKNFSPNDPAFRISQVFTDREFYKATPYYDPDLQILSVEELISQGVVQRNYWTFEALSIIEANKELLLS